ncbi:MAG: hypothetical protein GVY19_00265 [Bacteroidetes bacterium]|jgi:hypothetical protein|nr:hypothetical protein [Bacteroidota bacterium]
MKKILILRTFIYIFLILPGQSLIGQSTNNCKRADTFFGLHFDFHAGPESGEVGKNVSKEMVQKIIDATNPDFLQTDCKGHAGYASYPTKIGTPAPGFVNDPLKIWSDVTRENNVQFYVHYSGVLDGQAVKKHPEWATIKADKTRADRTTSLYSPYVDSLMIPQLKEIIDRYQVDGFWIDGECWGTGLDYSLAAQEAYIKQTGSTDIPWSSKHPGFHAYRQVQRQAFRDYLKHYLDAIHAYKPNTCIVSNYAYTHQMPETVTLPMDFLSGDMSPLNAINGARLDARIMCRQGIHWDLMSWGFTHTWTDEGGMVYKPAKQLMQEASIVLSHGGAYQVYTRQNKNGGIYEWTLPVLSEVAEFCRDREPWCYQSTPVNDVGLVYATAAYYKQIEYHFAPGPGKLDFFNGHLQCLLASGQNTGVVLEDNLLNEQDISEFGTLIYPEWGSISPELKSLLLNYAEKGGNLIVIGPDNAKIFKESLDIDFLNEPLVRTNGLMYKDMLANIQSASVAVKPGDKVQSFGVYYDDWDTTTPTRSAATITNHGKGKIACVYFDSGKNYAKRATTVQRDFMDALIDHLMPEPSIQMEGTNDIDVVNSFTTNGQQAIHLVNTAGPHSNENNYLTFDDFPRSGPLHLKIHADRKPRRLLLQPANQAIPFEYNNNKITCTIPEIDVYQILVIE